MITLVYQVLAGAHHGLITEYSPVLIYHVTSHVCLAVSGPLVALEELIPDNVVFCSLFVFASGNTLTGPEHGTLFVLYDSVLASFRDSFEFIIL